MPDRLLTLTDDEDAALQRELQVRTDARTPEQWLRDAVAWALGPVTDRYRIARADAVLATLAQADPAQAVGTVQAAIDARVVALAPVTVAVAEGALPPVVAAPPLL